MSHCLRCGTSGRRSATNVELARLHDVAQPTLTGCPPAFAVQAWSRPARVIGGDLLATWAVGGSALAVFLADVMGHGTPAALVASGMRAVLHQLRLERESRPGEVLARLDRVVGELYPEYFATATACLVEATGTLTFAQAGHPPILVRSVNGQVASLRQRSLPLGLNPGTIYEERQVELPVGATMLLYSDGVSDALARADVPGLVGLTRVVRESRHGDASGLVRAIRRSLRGAGEGSKDDRSMVAVQRQG